MIYIIYTLMIDTRFIVRRICRGYVAGIHTLYMQDAASI